MKLHNLINPELELKIEDNKITIEEKQVKNNTLKNITITNLPENTFVFSIDKKDVNICNGKCRNQLLNSEDNKINKACDCIIFYYEDKYLDLLFCELKSMKLEANRYENQLINSKLFVDYLLVLFRQFYNNEIFEIRKIEFLLFYMDRKLQICKTLRNKVEIDNQPKYENMKNYPEKIIKYPLQKTHHNYIEWEDLAANFNPN
ncbi:MAG: hypothetical protein QM487_15240 [Candidatus Marithrix sp.]